MQMDAGVVALTATGVVCSVVWPLCAPTAIGAAVAGLAGILTGLGIVIRIVVRS